MGGIVGAFHAAGFTPDEMEKILLAAQARILPLLAIGGFAGIRTAEICKLD
jgi:predicted acylesterase/phospholipase RssA